MKKAPVVVLLVAAIVTAAASAMSFSSWSAAASAETISGSSTSLNTEALEGCPFVAQRGDILYFASNRAGSMGGSIDIWISVRTETGGWGTPVNFTAVNSTSDELCPAAHRNGKDFLFVSNRPGFCGGDDIWRTRLHATRGWAAPSNLGCTVNSAANEASPYLLENVLYFGSNRAGGFSSAGDTTVSGDADIYTSAFDGSSFSAPVLAAGLNTAQNEFRPNLRRDGLEIFFDSNRTGSLGTGTNDIWTATRASTANPWSGVTRLDSNVNSPANEVRPSLSWDGTTLYFGSTRAGEGSQDLYFSTRSKLTGP